MGSLEGKKCLNLDVFRALSLKPRICHQLRTNCHDAAQKSPRLHFAAGGASEEGGRGERRQGGHARRRWCSPGTCDQQTRRRYSSDKISLKMIV